MEPAKIDWKTIESLFVIDDMYENIKAPKWVDFSGASPDKSLDDEGAWFCRPDCNHPKTVEDLLQLNVGSKVQRSAILSETLPMGDRNRRNANLKRRPGIARPLQSSKKGTKSEKIVVEGGENVNPNLYSTPSHQYNKMKSVIESSTEKKKNTNNKKETDKVPQQQLKKTLSARNLFGGRDIINQISEFCNELKRLATRAKEREPLLEKEGRKCGEELDKSNVMKEEEEIKVRDKKNVEDTKNTPPNSFSLDLNEKKKKNKDREAAAIKIQTCPPPAAKIQTCPPSPAAKIQTCPPSPQCFSAGLGPTAATRTPPLKPASRSRPKVRGILQELDQKNRELSKEVSVDHNNTTNDEQGKAASPIVLEREAPQTLDVFWFLKPCTHLSG